MFFKWWLTHALVGKNSMAYAVLTCVDGKLDLIINSYTACRLKSDLICLMADSKDNQNTDYLCGIS